MNPDSLFYEEFDKNRSNDSREYSLWKSLRDDAKQNKEYTSLYSDLKLGKKFQQTFNSQEHFIARLFELYTHKFLRKKQIKTESIALSNSQIDLIFYLDEQRFICELCCVNPTDEQINNKVIIQGDGFVKSPPGDNDQAVNSIRKKIIEKSQQLKNSAEKTDIKVLIFCDARYRISDEKKCIGLFEELRKAIYGEKDNLKSQADDDKQLQDLTSKIDYIVFCGYVPEETIIPLDYKLLYPLDDYKLGRNPLAYDNKMKEVFEGKI